MRFLPILSLSLLSAATAQAQSTRVYGSSGLDGLMFSSARITDASGNNETATLRFSAIAFGRHFHYDFGKAFGIFSGIDIKNIGFIEKIDRPGDDSTVKRRLYTIGVPLGIKFGSVAARNYGFLGGGVDVPLNYREKGFVDRGDKEKFNEWLSDRTPRAMPFVFLGYALPSGDNGSLILKAQYYPGNFFNEDFREGGTPIYAGREVNLFYLSVAYDIRGGGKASRDNDNEDDGGRTVMAD